MISFDEKMKLKNSIMGGIEEYMEENNKWSDEKIDEIEELVFDEINKKYENKNQYDELWDELVKKYTKNL